jgi:hypothetical protein
VGVPQEGEAAGLGVAAPALDLLSYNEKTELIFCRKKLSMISHSLHADHVNALA